MGIHRAANLREAQPVLFILKESHELCEHEQLSETEQVPDLVNEEGGNPGNPGLIHGGDPGPGRSKLMFDRAQRCNTGNI